MRLYTLLKQIISSKQNKTWQKLGSVTGMLNVATFSLDGFSEVAVCIVTGGLSIWQSSPISAIPSRGTTFYFGTFGDDYIYVYIARTSAQITKWPAALSSYSQYAEIYAR